MGSAERVITMKCANGARRDSSSIYQLEGFALAVSLPALHGYYLL